jgi:hypothetical protein
MIKVRHMDSGDKQFLVGTLIAPVIVWWLFQGRKKYSVKGMTK